MSGTRCSPGDSGIWDLAWQSAPPHPPHVLMRGGEQTSPCPRGASACWRGPQAAHWLWSPPVRSGGPAVPPAHSEVSGSPCGLLGLSNRPEEEGQPARAAAAGRAPGQLCRGGLPSRCPSCFLSAGRRGQCASSCLGHTQPLPRPPQGKDEPELAKAHPGGRRPGQTLKRAGVCGRSLQPESSWPRPVPRAKLRGSGLRRS